MRARMRFRVAAVVAAASVVSGVAVGTAHADETPAAGVQIDAGGPGGDGFLPDSYVTGGNVDTNHSGINGLPNWARTVAHPIPQEQWNTFRYLESSYHIPALTPAASYEVRLYFDDWYWTHPGQRVFDVAVNHTVVLKDFDIIATTVTAGGDGKYLGVEKDFTVAADDSGAIDVDLIRGAADQPLINAIVVVPAA